MERRKFLQLLLVTSTLAIFPHKESLFATQSSVPAKPLIPGPKAKVFLAGLPKNSPENTIKQAVRSSAEAATDFSWLAKGDAVFIKTVINSANPYPSTTSPTAVAAMIEMLKKKGAGRIIVGDMSGVEKVRFSPTSLSGSSRTIMKATGLADAALAAGAELHFFEEAGWNAFYEETPIKGSNWKRPLMMPNILKEAQHIVLMPRCARHILAGSTLGMKSSVGYWRHDTRLEYHRDAATLQEKTAEANMVETLRKKQRLVITQADKILTTFGPDDGYVFQPETGLIIAAESLVAHDMISLAWLLDNRHNIPESEKDSFLDTSRLIPKIVNHIIVNWLGGLGQAISSETFAKNPLETIWDDRVLRHAFEIFGGVPQISLKEANNGVSADIKKRLTEMTAGPF